ncbi:MAG: cadmium-translocating P-type ATPase [Chloroflexota bacterium]|nr:cadmium-translocating P-type ATPase [Chloroflexota bacterium]
MAPVPEGSPKPTTVDLPIVGMDCASCATQVEGAIKQLPGVEDVRVLIAAERASVAFDPDRVTVDQLKAAVVKAGYRVPTEVTEQIVEVPIQGMDCADCTRSVQQALTQLAGVQSADVLLSAEKAVIRLDPAQVDRAAIRKAVEGAGYRVPEVLATPEVPPAVHAEARGFTRAIFGLLGVVFGAVLFIVVVGEWLGLFEALTERVPFPVGVAIVLAFGFPVFRNVVRATLRRQIISHTLMSVGVLAALAVGQWATAAVVVFFMRVGDFAEHFTTERGRRAVKDLMALSPQTARVERDGREEKVPVGQVRVGEIVVVRPGETIPVDGEVVAGQATVNQAAITGESVPAEVEPGAQVFAATIAQLGSLRVRATGVGPDTTFGRVIRLVEEAETHRAEVQRLADRFSAWFLPIVATIAALTFLLSRDPLATAAVLVVACSCSLALATPIAMLATIGAAAKQGLLIKGGKHVEALARADVVLLDKTGTLTLGRPQVTDVVPLNGLSQAEILALTAAAERDSEHPLAEAVRAAAATQQLSLRTVDGFEAVPGQGVRARIDDSTISVGSRRLVPTAAALPQLSRLEDEGKTTLVVARDGEPVGVLGAADTLRPEVPAALEALQRLGVRRIELLTGDNERTAKALAERLGVAYRAELLPEDKIAVVRDYQAQGHTVVMIGDGVNDAPALSQANVGIAMGAAGTDVALEAAHVALMREDWSLVPEVFRLARRTMRVVKVNIGFTAAYNVVGLTLAALGFLPPIFAAAAQSLPDLGIMANSVRLLRQEQAPR